MRSDNFVREKRTFCGKDFLEVDIYNLTGKQTAVSKKSRARRYRESAPKQKNFNDKRSRRYLGQLLNCNFVSGDFHVTCTYSRENLPHDVSEAYGQARNYLRRLSAYAKKLGYGKPKYVLVTSVTSSKTGQPVRVHHHIVLSCPGLSRQEIENLWRKPRCKGEVTGKKIGYCNCDVIDAEGSRGLIPLASYLCRQGGTGKRWTASVGLNKPYFKLNDDRYSRTEVMRYVKERISDRSFWERRYPGWVIADSDYGIRCEYSEVSGWGIYLLFRRRD